jgi:glycine C-acetyltransferase
VPKGMARIRIQISAAHSKDDIDKCLAAFEKVGKKHKVIS